MKVNNPNIIKFPIKIKRENWDMMAKILDGQKYVWFGSENEISLLSWSPFMMKKFKPNEISLFRVVDDKNWLNYSYKI